MKPDWRLDSTIAYPAQRTVVLPCTRCVETFLVRLSSKGGHYPMFGRRQAKLSGPCHVCKIHSYGPSSVLSNARPTLKQPHYMWSWWKCNWYWLKEHEAEKALKGGVKGCIKGTACYWCCSCFCFPPKPPPDTCLAHENGETCPCQRGEKRIHRPQCGDLTVSPQTTVNTNYFWHFVKCLVLQIRPDFPFGGWNRNVTIISTWFQSGLHKEQVFEHIV